jgi:hypothetical protein
MTLKAMLDAEVQAGGRRDQRVAVTTDADGEVGEGGDAVHRGDAGLVPLSVAATRVVADGHRHRVRGIGHQVVERVDHPGLYRWRDDRAL